MKKSLLLFLTGIIVLLLLLEVIFRLLPVSTATRSGYYIHPLILTYPSHHCFTAATGWDLKNVQRNCANNLGFLTDRDFVQNPQAIALIGDSFVEANMLRLEERLSGQLETMLNGLPVYSMGGPGSSLLDYAERAKYAADKFGIRTFVFVLERGDVKQALCGSGNIHGSCIDLESHAKNVEIQASPGFLKRVVRESALAQYIFSQLKFSFSSLGSHLRPVAKKLDVDIPAQKSREMAIDRIVTSFFDELSKIGGGRFFILIDPDRANLFSQRSLEPEGVKELSTKALVNGINIINVSLPFQEYVSSSVRVLEIGPYDKHWNRDATKIVAGAIAKAIAMNQLP
jgi:hypothetical protein